MANPEDPDVIRSRQIDANNAWAKSHIEKAENWLDDQADRQRALIPPYNTLGLLMHDGTVGIVKTAYHLAKGLLGLAMDVGRLKDDPVYRENVAQKVWNGAVWLAKEARISQGSQGIEGIQDQNERIIAFSKGLWDKAKKGWEAAGEKPGHQTQLVVEIAANIALFFVGAGEAKAAVEGTSVASKLGETGRVLDAAEVGCKTVIMSTKEILAEQAARDAAAALKAAEDAKAAKDAALAAKAAEDSAKAAKGAGAVKMSPYGDLTAEELEKLQKVAKKTGKPVDVVGSTAKGKRRGIGEDLPLGKGEGTKSDLDIRINGQDEIDMRGGLSDAIYDEFPKGKDIDHILSGDPHPGEPRITVNPDGSVSTSGNVPIRE